MMLRLSKSLMGIAKLSAEDWNKRETAQSGR